MLTRRYSLPIAFASTLICGVLGADDAVDFRRDVVPVLTKVGCNGGTCHGSFKGRGDFRLSLLGFDPLADYDALTKESRGRRVSVAAPMASLILRKPTGRLPHGGGFRLADDSESFHILRRWIEGGAPGPAADDPVVVRLEVTPSELVLQPDAEAALQVRAVWSDGVTRDVTRWALYDAQDEQMIEVSPLGAVKAVGQGRSAVTVRYQGQVAAVTLTVPFRQIGDYPTLPTFNFIDEHALASWRALGLLPADLCDDATFLRRASLDLIGTLPTPAEIREFCASTDPQKRSKLIDALLDRREYVDYWSMRWSDMLRAHRRSLGEKGLASFQTWIHDHFRQNAPADRIVRELLVAQGNLYASGAVAFYFVDTTPQDLAETTAQVFLGVRLQCARCHHHPFEVWSQDDYYGLAAVFAKVKRKDTREAGRFGGVQAVLFDELGNVPHPQTGAAVKPRLLGHQPLELDAQADPREPLGQWLTARDNPFFAKNIVNRYWGFLFGRGLVHPIDDMRNTNPASHPELLDALAADLVQHDYDLKHLLRTICNSRVYQLAAEITPARDEANVFLTHHRPRRLPAEVLLDAVNQTTQTAEQFPNLPRGMRAIELPDSAVASDFLDIFGRPRRATACECERGQQPDLRQSLHLANSEFVHQKVIAKDGRVAKLLAASKNDDEMIEDVYLATLSRWPSDEERAFARQCVAEAPSRPEAFEDLLWTLINCAEFSFTR